MIRAYSTGSPGSREARDSLAEATRGHREYTEVRDGSPEGRGTGYSRAGERGMVLDPPLVPVHLSQSMCLLESELESQLGEFHLRMKGTKLWGQTGGGERGLYT